MPHLKLYVRILITALLFMLAACSTERTPGLQRALEFDICRDALELPAPKRAFQGYDGWFFFNHEFKEDYKMLTPEQAGFVTELNRAFATQGVRLIAVPVPGRAAVRPGVLYPGDPKQRAFSPTAARAYYANYLRGARISSQGEHGRLKLRWRLMVADVKSDEKDISQDREAAKGTHVVETFYGQVLQIEKVFELTLKRFDGGFA